MNFKKITAVLSTAAIACTAAGTMVSGISASAANKYTFILGDADNNGVVDFWDGVTVRNYVNEKKASIPNSKQADFNFDGKITIEDANLIDKYIDRVFSKGNLLGDADGDGTVDIYDYVTMGKYFNNATACAAIPNCDIDFNGSFDYNDYSKLSSCPLMVKGDVDLDGKVTNNDSILLQQYLSDKHSVTINYLNGDMNKDGKITIADVVALNKIKK